MEVIMQFEDNPFVELARRARSGDPAAAEEFRREMSLALEGMVRLALRKRIGFSPFEEHARAQANRLHESSDWQLPFDELSRRTADWVCQAMIDHLQAGSRVQDTIASSFAGHRASKTVVRSQSSVQLESRL
jgi:hypothetical protein